MRSLNQKGPARDMSSDLLGHVFGERYVLDRQLGRGGIGVVYYAIDKKLGDRPVAVKVLSEMMGMRKAQRRRFEREARALAALSHPNVVSVIDYGVAEHTPYLVMELLRGESLSQLLANEAPLDWTRALHLMNQVLAGLTYVHERNIAHRDLKPGNLFVQDLPGMGERVKLLDFGLAKFLDPSDDASTLTRSGEIFGTPGYMPPEQLLGKGVDTRADVYSACVLFYEMLSGRKPFAGGGIPEILKRQLSGDVPRLVDADTGRVAHPALDALFARGMAVDIDKRFRDARELARAIAALPERAVVVQSDEERRRERRARHEGAARAEQGSELPTVAEARGAAAQRVPGARSTRESKHGVVARTISMLAGMLGGLLRLSAVLLTILSLLVIGLAGVVIYLSSRPDLADTRDELREVLKTAPAKLHEQVAAAMAQEPHQPVTAEHSDVPPAPAPESAAKVSARDPWRGGVPPALQSARTAMLRNRVAGEKTFAALRRYNSEHRDDARGHLLLAGLYMNRSWFSDAVEQYELAFRSDPSARGDTHALQDLLSLASQSDAVWTRARVLLRDTYGAELTQAIDQALKRRHLPLARARLVALGGESSMPAQRKEP